MGSVGTKTIQVVSPFFFKSEPSPKKARSTSPTKTWRSSSEESREWMEATYATLESLESSAQPWRYFQQKQAGSPKNWNSFNVLLQHNLPWTFGQFLKKNHIDKFQHFKHVLITPQKNCNMELENSPPLNTRKSFELIWTITKRWLFPFQPFDFGGTVTLTFTPPLFCSPSILPTGNQRESPGCPGHLAENVAHAWVPSKHQRPETGWLLEIPLFGGPKNRWL